MVFRPGQVICYRADYRSRASILISLLARSPWTHTSLVVRGGSEADAVLLNTYPATDAVMIPADRLLEHREYVVLDLPDEDESWRGRVERAAYGLLGREYWLSPCSRVVALAFMKAGVDFLVGGPRSFRERIGALWPHEYLTRTRLRTVHESFNLELRS